MCDEDCQKYPATSLRQCTSTREYTALYVVPSSFSILQVCDVQPPCSPSPAAALPKLVMKINDPQVKGVDADLLRLYGPVMWRSLRVANPSVRAQVKSDLPHYFFLSYKPFVGRGRRFGHSLAGHENGALGFAD